MKKTSDQSKERLLGTPIDAHKEIKPKIGGQNILTPIEQRWQSRILRGTPHQLQRTNSSIESQNGSTGRQAQLAAKLNSSSRLRQFFFKAKREMILSPMRGFMTNVVVGFLVNVQLMISVVIVFEKLTDDILSYTKSVIPLITLSSLLLFLCLFSMCMLMSDLFQKGCLAWHRDSVGILIQRVTFTTCLLFTSIYLYQYVDEHEHQKEKDEYASSIIGCFSPMFVFFCLLVVKVLYFTFKEQLQLLCIKTRNTLLWLVVIVSITGLTAIFHYEFDEEGYNMPAFIKAVPIAIILLAYAGNQLWQIIYEKDLVKIMIYGYDSTIRKFITIISGSFTICFVISLITSLYLIENRQKGHEDIKDILQFILMTLVGYLGLQIEAAGSFTVDIIFEQFYFEMIEETNKNSKYLTSKKANPQKNNRGRERSETPDKEEGKAKTAQVINQKDGTTQIKINKSKNRDESNSRVVPSIKSQTLQTKNTDLQKPLLGNQRDLEGADNLSDD
ncbi:UNKNOWN [Stylonychia lemnae]|uniref:Transmembrane protein n=1 Tax=Stylonychia lemnae TaxID=5949 RepID=A0A078AUW7_STYLE|nr:UNKNOWN [Stylonychia lemnae]|eukprot:CDW85796.1 UNKNOWN [Stylonychia lemnae]